MFTDADLPGKFAEDEIRVGVGSLEMLVHFAEVISRSESRLRQLFANADVVPMAVVFGEVARGFVRIEENIFVPVIANAVDGDAAALETDDFVIGAAKFAARAEGDERANFPGNDLKPLQDLKIRVLGIQNGMATFANHGFGVAQRAKRDGCSALRTIQGFRLRFWRIREWRRACTHHQPSKLRRFLSLRSSNSTNSPR